MISQLASLAQRALQNHGDKLVKQAQQTAQQVSQQASNPMVGKYLSRHVVNTAQQNADKFYKAAQVAGAVAVGATAVNLAKTIGKEIKQTSDNSSQGVNSEKTSS